MTAIFATTSHPPPKEIKKIFKQSNNGWDVGLLMYSTNICIIKNISNTISVCVGGGEVDV